MSNRWLRFVIALLAIVVSVAAGFRISQLEQQLGSDVSKSRAGETAAQTAIESLGDLKAALHAYVAPSQSQSFWMSRATMFTDKVRGALLELDGAATAAGAPVTESLATLEKLQKSELRARNYLLAGQSLLAGDVIFTEGRDLLDAMRVQVAHARGEVAKAAGERQSALRREQWMLALGGVGILALAVLVLVPPARVQETAALPSAAPEPAAAIARSSEAGEYARVISKAPVPAGAPSSSTSRPAAQVARPAAAPTVRTSTSSTARPAATGSQAAKAAPPVKQATSPVQPAAAASSAAPPAPAAPAPVPLADAAAVCVDLARLSDGGEISKLLERAAGVLNASGIVIWMASEDRAELFPAAAAGYDERLFNRIGAIPREASNLTAAAFREGSSKTSAGADSAAAALAVPLIAPDGPVGVLSAELKAMADVDQPRLAVATIFAAQLSTLLGSIAVPAPAAAAATATAEAQTAQGR